MSDHEAKRDAAYRLALGLLRQLNEIAIAETGHPLVAAAEFCTADVGGWSPVRLDRAEIDVGAGDTGSLALPCPGSTGERAVLASALADLK
jgi:hypothetical protein